MARGVIWVYRSGNVWVVKKEGTSKASAIRNTRNEAYEAARNIAINQNLTIKVQGGGSIQNRRPRRRHENDDDCFITTACVKYYNLPDDCYQLTTLRKFRDTYLSQTDENKELIKQYYSGAPQLVKLLEKDTDKIMLFSTIFKQINASCNAIEEGRYKKAKEIYCAVVLFLEHRYRRLL